MTLFTRTLRENRLRLKPDFYKRYRRKGTWFNKRQNKEINYSIEACDISIDISTSVRLKLLQNQKKIASVL